MSSATEKPATIKIIGPGRGDNGVVYYVQFAGDRAIYVVTSSELKKKYPLEFLQFLESKWVAVL